PSQREMMKRWGISMQTASKVIGAMKTERLAVPSPGRDTIVAPGAAARIAAAAQGIARAPAASLPPAPGAEVTAATARKAPAARAAPRGRSPATPRPPPGPRARPPPAPREGGAQPASIPVSWSPPGIADRAPRLAGSQPLPAGTLAYIAEATGTRAARADEDHAAAPADAGTAAALGISPGSPVLITTVRYHAPDGTPIEYAETTTPPGRRYSRTYAITGN